MYTKSGPKHFQVSFEGEINLCLMFMSVEHMVEWWMSQYLSNISRSNMFISLIITLVCPLLNVINYIRKHYSASLHH